MPSATPMVRRLVFLWLGVWLASSLTTLSGSGGLSAWLSLDAGGVRGGEFGALLGVFAYAFVHAPFPSILHVGLNGWIAWLLGPEVEILWPGRQFVKFILYAIGWGAAFHLSLGWVLDGLFLSPALGGSGIVMAILGAQAVVYPGRRISLVFFSCPLRALFLCLASLDLLGLVFMAAGQSQGVAADVHLAGAVFGWTWAGGWRLDSMPWIRWKEALASRRSEAGARRRREGEIELDRILGKISDSGLSSLTTEEKEFLNSRSQADKKSRPRKG